MAITVLQQPTTPNASDTKLIYSVTSSNANQFQFQYVTDIYESGSSELLTRLFTYPNPIGSGIVEIGKILSDNLDYDYNWKAEDAVSPIDNVKTFDIRFGEAYSNSLTSSVTVYTGSTPNLLEVFPATVDPNSGNYNFNTSSFDPLGNIYFTNAPAAQTSTSNTNNEYAYLVNSHDYMTLTQLESNATSLQVWGLKVENGVSSLVRARTINFNSGNGKFETIGIGPRNLGDVDANWSLDILNGDINALLTVGDPGGVAIYINDKWDGILPTSGTAVIEIGLNGLKQPLKQCSDEYTRFAFINNYGFWDYYNVYNPTRESSTVTRNTFTSPNVDYSSATSTYDITRRGEKQYNVEYTDRYEITTDYLDENMSDWLTEMFDSPEVYVQVQEGVSINFIPIIITNTSYERNTNENRQKQFQYTIEYRYANQRYSR